MLEKWAEISNRYGKEGGDRIVLKINSPYGINAINAKVMSSITIHGQISQNVAL